MKKFIIFIVVLLIVGLGVYYFLLKKDVGTELNNNITNNIINKIPTPSESTSGEISVDIKNFSFNPNTLNVKVGTKVTWTNNDFAPHTVTSDVGNLLDSPTLSPGESFSFTFTTAGSVSYHCNIHKSMKASVNVVK